MDLQVVVFLAWGGISLGGVPSWVGNVDRWPAVAGLAGRGRGCSRVRGVWGPESPPY